MTRRTLLAALPGAILMSEATFAAPIPQPRPTGTYYDTNILPRETDCFATAEYRLWLPPNLDKVRGVIVRQHGCGNGATAYGLVHAHDVQWQALAAKHGCALLGTRLLPKALCPDWADPLRGTADALFAALKNFATLTRHPEIADAPLVLHGHSGGGFWSTIMLLTYPERITAIIAARSRLLPEIGTGAGRVNDLDQAIAARVAKGIPAASLQVPTVWATGVKDEIIHAKADHRPLFNRPADSVWTLAASPVAGHELGTLRSFALPYFDAVLTQRLPEKIGQPLRPLDQKRAWLGDITGAIWSTTDFPANADRTHASFLPNETTAKLWQNFVTTGKATAPEVPRKETRLPSPYTVRAQRAPSGTVTITWEYDMPLDGSPVPTFEILRDNTLIGRLEAPRSGYGDDPIPRLWQPRYHDTTATNPESVYAVQAIGEGGFSILVSKLALPTNAPPVPNIPLPDLTITDISLTPATPCVGDSVQLTVTVKNIGDAPTPPNTPIGVNLNISPLAPMTHRPLKPGQSTTLLSLTVPTESAWKPMKEGEITITAEADDLNRIPEKDKSNNILQKKVTIKGTS